MEYHSYIETTESYINNMNDDKLLEVFGLQYEKCNILSLKLVKNMVLLKQYEYYWLRSKEDLFFRRISERNLKK